MENLTTDSQVDESSVTPESYSKNLVQNIIRMIGDDPFREGVLDTPRRVVKSWKEIFGGYKMDADKVLGTTFEGGGYDQIIVCKDIEMYSTCEHHMIPFYGTVHIGYIPKDRVVGLSKLARLVEVFSRRLQIQEKLTQQIADTMERVLTPIGVIVIVEAKHLCMCARGVGKQNSKMVTSAIHGAFKEQGPRTEFLELIK
jgi:GTP cyclohydrolase I